jgi:hypothetical protein
MFTGLPVEKLFGWYKDEPDWLKLLAYAREKYQEKFPQPANIGFVHPDTFTAKQWSDGSIVILKSLYCLPKCIFLGQIDAEIYQGVLDSGSVPSTSENEALPVQG